jgi:hypothetical protein
MGTALRLLHLLACIYGLYCEVLLIVVSIDLCFGLSSSIDVRDLGVHGYRLGGGLEKSPRGPMSDRLALVGIRSKHCSKIVF